MPECLPDGLVQRLPIETASENIYGGIIGLARSSPVRPLAGLPMQGCGGRQQERARDHRSSGITGRCSCSSSGDKTSTKLERRARGNAHETHRIKMHDGASLDVGKYSTYVPPQTLSFQL
jgi:hypothetical protein